MKKKSAAIITNFNIKEKYDTALKVAELLEGRDVEILVDSVADKSIRTQGRAFPSYRVLSPDQLCNGADFAVVLGGDGSIIDALKRAAAYSTPVIGINFGRVGFLAELERDEIDMLNRVVDGDFRTEERSMLFVQIFSESGQKKFADFAANEAVISNGSISKIVDLQVSENDVLISNVRADGLIITTPTGSTAYSLSAGGPIIDPRVKCLCLTPICPHSLTVRPIVFSENAVIDIKYMPQRVKNIYLTIDGRKNTELCFGDRVSVSKANRAPIFIRLKEHSFYTKLSSKLK